MKKAWTALVLTVTLSLGLAAPAAAAGSFADVPAGTKIGNLYATDIAAVWDGAVVPSYNIGGRTAVVLQDLADYGFLVEWTPGDGVNGGRVSVTTQALRRPSLPISPRKPRPPVLWWALFMPRIFPWK